MRSSRKWGLRPDAQEGDNRRCGQRRHDRGAGGGSARLRRRRARRHHREPPAREGARSERGRPGARLRAEGRRIEQLRADGRLGPDRDHVRQAAFAGDEPRRPRHDQREHRRCGDESGGRAVAGRDPRRRHQPPRRDVSCREARIGLPEGPRLRDGRHPRHGAVQDVHRVGDRGFGEGHPGGRARRPRRPDGSRRLGDVGRRRAARRARGGRSRSRRWSSGRGRAAARS